LSPLAVVVASQSRDSLGAFEVLLFLFGLIAISYGIGWLMGRRWGDRQGAQKYYVMGYDAGVNYAIEKLYAGKVRYEERAG
jgi:hypothetical protein